MYKELQTHWLTYYYLFLIALPVADGGENMVMIDGDENMVVIYEVYKIQSVTQAVAPKPGLIETTRFT